MSLTRVIASPTEATRQSIQASGQGLISLLQYRWSIAALLAVCLPCLLWLKFSASSFAIGIALVRLLTLRRHPRPWHWLVRTALVVLAVVIVVMIYSTIIGREPGAALLLVMLGLKSTESATRRDARVLVSASLFVIIANFFMTQSLLSLVLCAFGSVICFSALEMLTRPAVGGPTRSPLSRLAVGEVFGLLALALPFAALLWLFFPRLATPLWGAMVSEQAKSGLSDTMEPGSMAELIVDDTPMMRIRFDNDARPDPNTLYFRGPVLWFLDETGRWSTRESMRFMADAPEPAKAGDLTYEVMLEATNQRMLFAAEQAISVSESRTNFNFEQRFFAARPITELISYRARSRLSDRIALDKLPNMQRDWGVQFPPNINPKAQALAKQWASELQNDPQQIVARALQYFREEDFRYSLTPGAIEEQDKVDVFLFDRRVGYCEHYASAFAMLMRAAGVPTRVVTGFAGGRYLPFADYLLVQKNRAHAWNEVLIDNQWIRVDPTGVIPQDRIELGAEGNRNNANLGWWGTMKLRMDVVSDWWNRVVVGFNAASQAKLLKPFGIENASWENLVSALVLTISVIAAIAAAIFFWRRPRRTIDPATALYQQACAHFAKLGWPRETAEAPRDYLLRITQLAPANAAAFAVLTQTFEQSRFADDQANETQLLAMRTQLQIIVGKAT